MHKKSTLATLMAMAMVAVAFPAQAAVQVTSGPTSLVTSPITAKASSAQIGLLSITLNQDTGETLSSMSVTINNNGSSTASSSDLASVSVYKDNGDGNFNSSTDALAGSQSTVNIGSATTVTTASNNTLTGGKFFVSFATSSSWSSTSPADSITATIGASGVVTSSNSPTLTPATTAAITADTAGPALQSAMAKNTGGTSTTAKEAGDSIELTFSEGTNKPSLTAANIASVFSLNNSHSFLDGVASIGGSAWSTDGLKLTITLSAGTSVPTVEPGDTVTIAGSTITDSLGNTATGNAVISGSFVAADTTGPALQTAVAKNTGGTSAKEAGDSIELAFSETTNKPAITASNIATTLTLNNSHSFLDGAGALGSAIWNTDGKKLTITLSAGTSLPTVAVGDSVTIAGSVIKDAANNNATGTVIIGGAFDGTTSSGEDQDEEHGRACPGGIINGRLYKIGSASTVYLAAGCRLKPFRGAAVFHARGHKFQNITVLSAAPSGVTISDKPALPAGGTLVKSPDKLTVFFVTPGGTLSGFINAKVFLGLGFKFGAVQTISASDLQTMAEDSTISSTSTLPDGAVFKCGSSALVFEVKQNTKFPFASAEAFQNRGHSFEHIAIVDCGRFGYSTGANIQ